MERAYLADHSLILRLKCEDMVVQLFPGLAYLGIDVIHNVLQPLVECLLGPGLLIEVACAIFYTVDVTARKGVERMHGDNKLRRRISAQRSTIPSACFTLMP